MRIEQMRQLLEIAKYKSLNIACQNMHISQQALSASVKKMEEELGCDLFYRNAHGVVLTERGKYFANGFNKILMDYDMLLKDNRTNRQTKKDWHIAIGFGVMESFLAEILTEYLNINRFCNFHTIETDNKKSVQKLLNDDVLLAINTYSNVNSTDFIATNIVTCVDEITVIPLFTSPLYVKVSEESPLAQMSKIPLSALINERILIYNNKSWEVNYMQDTCQHMNLELTFELEENYQLHANMVRCGHGVSFGILEGKFYRHEKGIKYIQLDLPIIISGECIVKSKNYEDPELRHFINHLLISCTK